MQIGLKELSVMRRFYDLITFAVIGKHGYFAVFSSIREVVNID
jgi:hypothetical protein